MAARCPNCPPRIFVSKRPYVKITATRPSQAVVPVICGIGLSITPYTDEIIHVLIIRILVILIVEIVPII